MRITFVLANLGICGGNRTIFTCSNLLVQRGHTVNIVHPIIPIDFRLRNAFKQLRFLVITILKNILRGNQVSWFDLQARLIWVLSLTKFGQGMVPESDLVIATAAETASFVSKLDDSCGKKLYFVQHYEAWEIWDDKVSWQKINVSDDDPKRDSLNMALVTPESPVLKKYKEKVDNTYLLPLKKFTTSTWLKELVEKKLKQKVVGRVDIGNNFEVFFNRGKASKSGRLIVVPFREIMWKGGQDAIAAMEIVRGHFSDIEIVFFGPKGSWKSVPVWAKYYSAISDSALSQLYSSADIFVLPSWVEGWSSPPMEAMACETACVCTDVGAVSDYSISGETAIIVSPRNPMQLAKACLDLLQDDGKRKRIAQAGCMFIQRFTFDHTVDQMEEIFRQVLYES